MKYQSILLNGISWVFGILIFAMGVVNSFWGNDPGLGVGLLLLSFIYYPPVNNLIRIKTGFKIPVVVKIILGLFLLWVCLGVGELFNKVDMMLEDLK